MSNRCNHVLKYLSERSQGRKNNIVKVIKLIWTVASGLQKASFWRALRNTCFVNRRLKKLLVSFGTLSHTFKTV